ncbi:replication initiation protein [Burkholderia vietnamiensis]|uniref:replication initiation protein n=1 Tax=Burkholderia vietnamiensis TaxID=60552 RepID=UPI001CF47835|nr:replication initiation protein [Burkholderia vietnamiensis]MCA8285399.1 replication initiation protein [Burkholderia vietnamiensis]
MEKIELEEKLDNKVLKRFVKHETELIKSSNTFVDFKLREKWEALHYKNIELNQKLLFYIALKITSLSPINKIFDFIEAEEPTIIIQKHTNKFEAYMLYELETAVFKDENTKAYSYYLSVANKLSKKFDYEEVEISQVIYNPFHFSNKVLVSDKRYELKELE